MNCPEFREWIDGLLLRDPDEAPPADVARHLVECVACAREHALALETLEAITPGASVVASPRLKERILAATPVEATMVAETADEPRRAVMPWGRRAVRTRLAFALAAAAILAMLLLPIGGGRSPSSNDGGAFGLLARASAAESRLFAADDVVSMSSEIVAEPLADAEMVAARWLPLPSIGADGKTRYDQLKLGDDLKKRYTFRDDSWYDPATHRFAHVVSLEGRPLFANSYDGRAIHRLEVDQQGHAQLKNEPVAAGFEPPKDPSVFLGLLAAGRPAGAKERIAGRPDMVHDDGPVKLADGSPARVLRLMLGDDDSGKELDSSFRVTIRDDTQMVESAELVISGEKIYTIHRNAAAGRREMPYGWDLAGLRPAIEKDKGAPRTSVPTLADMVRLDVSVDEMAKRADYPVYLFGHDPSWSARRQIVDILDVASPPHRMFAAVFPAKDRRHVVLFQAHCVNTEMKSKTREGRPLYTSPEGIKVWSSKDDRAMAKVLLSSFGSIKVIFTDTPSRDCTGYLLETPDGAFPTLAVNGVLTDAELHGLVDSLVRVRPK